MAKKFAELRAQMTPQAQESALSSARAMLAEMRHQQPYRYQHQA